MNDRMVNEGGEEEMARGGGGEWEEAKRGRDGRRSFSSERRAVLAPLRCPPLRRGQLGLPPPSSEGRLGLAGGPPLSGAGGRGQGEGREEVR